MFEYSDQRKIECLNDIIGSFNPSILTIKLNFLLKEISENKIKPFDIENGYTANDLMASDYDNQFTIDDNESASSWVLEHVKNPLFATMKVTKYMRDNFDCPHLQNSFELANGLNFMINEMLVYFIGLHVYSDMDQFKDKIKDILFVVKCIERVN